MKNKYFIILMILTLILMCGCNNKSNEVNNDNSTEVVNNENSLSLENTVWLNDNGNEYYFYSKSNKINFKEKTPDNLLYEGYYTITTNEKKVQQYKEFFEGSKDSLKTLFNEKEKNISNPIEIGLAINTNENEGIIHEYYGIYTDNKIVIAEIGSDQNVYILEKK